MLREPCLDVRSIDQDTTRPGQHDTPSRSQSATPTAHPSSAAHKRWHLHSLCTQATLHVTRQILQHARPQQRISTRRRSHLMLRRRVSWITILLPLELVHAARGEPIRLCECASSTDALGNDAGYLLDEEEADELEWILGVVGSGYL